MPSGSSRSPRPAHCSYVARAIRSHRLGSGSPAPFLLSAVAAAWRDSPILKALDLAAAAISVALAALPPATAIRGAGLAETAGGIVRLGWSSVSGVLAVVFEDVRWAELPRGRYATQAVAVGRGLAIGVPLLLVFGGLFVAADAVFQGLVTDALHIGNPLTHVAIGAVCAWVAVGVLRSVVVPAEAGRSRSHLPAPASRSASWRPAPSSARSTPFSRPSSPCNSGRSSAVTLSSSARPA